MDALNEYFAATQRDFEATSRDPQGRGVRYRLESNPIADAIEAATGQRIGALMIAAELWPIAMECCTRRPLWNAAQRRALGLTGTPCKAPRVK